MIFDILDLLAPRAQFSLTGKYYEERPDSPDIGAQEFNYEYVDPFSQSYRRLFANIQGSGGETAIRTNDQLNYKINGIIITQDGRAFKIIQCETDYQSVPKQAFRYLPVPVGTEFVLRLVKMDNPWGIQ